MQLIDRHALLKNVYDNPPEKARMTQGEWCRKCIYEAPTIEAEPVRHGRWAYGYNSDAEMLCHFCTACGKEAYWDTDYGQQLFKFCPNCGARMDATEPPEKE